MPAVADPPVLSKPKAERVYISRRSDLLLVLVRDKRRVSQETGETGESIQGKRRQFVEGRLTIPEKGVVRGARGERLTAKEAIEHLEGRGKPGEDDYIEPHDLLGDREEGFFKLPKVAPPMSEEEAQKVVELAIAGDVQALEDLHEAELTGWERTDLLELISDTLSKVRAAKPPAESVKAG